MSTTNWYNVVVRDLSRLPDCIAHFESELEAARYELTLKGQPIEKHSAELPGIVENRFGQLQVVEAILEHLNIELSKTRARVFRKFLETYNRQLSSRDAEKYTDGDPDVLGIAMLVNEFALIRNRYIALTKGLDQKSWQIGHITRLRCAGLEDAQV